LRGFVVRSPKPSEIPTLLGFCTPCPFGTQNVTPLGAFGQPGDVPLGAVVVRAVTRAGQSVGHFVLSVRIDCRRRGVGRMLMTHLYQLAAENRADRLVLAELIHEDRAENAFCRAVGLSPQRTLGTYRIPIGHGFATVCEPVARRFERSHPHLVGTSVLPLRDLDAGQVARFFAANYGGFIDCRLEQLRSDHFDLSISNAITRDGEIRSAMLVRSRVGEPTVFVDLMASTPALRNGPAPLVLLAHAAPVASVAGFTHCVFEADADHDRFAVGAAIRCGATMEGRRYRYAIERAAIESRASPGPVSPAPSPLVGDAQE
jgi:ribosomal protein S18 acetylase RimI-like enzyme